MDYSKDKSLASIKDKIKNFFKKVSNEKDRTIEKKKINREQFDSSEQHLYRDDLKMY